MNKQITKSEQEWEKLEQCFRGLEQANPEENASRMLTWAVVDGGRFSARTIIRGVNQLVDERSYCNDIYCRRECFRFHSRDLLKDYLLQWAYPAVMKMVHLTREDLVERSVETVGY